MITSLIFQHTETGKQEFIYLANLKRGQITEFIKGKMKEGFQLLSKYKQESVNNGNI